MNSGQYEFVRRALAREDNRPALLFGYVIQHQGKKIAVAADRSRMHICHEPPEHPFRVGDVELLPTEHEFEPRWAKFLSAFSLLDEFAAKIGTHKHQAMVNGHDSVQLLNAFNGYYFTYLVGYDERMYLADGQGSLIALPGQLTEGGELCICMNTRFLMDIFSCGGREVEIYVFDDDSPIYFRLPRLKCDAWIMPGRGQIFETVENFEVLEKVEKIILESRAT